MTATPARADPGGPTFTIDAESSALLVVDMQNDFVREGAPLEVPDARATAPIIAELASAFRRKNRPVVYTAFLAGPAPTLVWGWSPQLAPPVRACWRGVTREYRDVTGTRDCAAVIDELAPEPGDPVVDKYGYNAFHRTNLTSLLLANAVDTVCVTGTVTQLCVEGTARGAFEEGFRTVVVSDAVSSYDAALHEATLANMARKFGRVEPSTVVLKELDGR